MFYPKHVYYVRLQLLGTSVYNNRVTSGGMFDDKGLFTKIFYDQSFGCKEEHPSDSGEINMCTEYW